MEVRFEDYNRIANRCMDFNKRGLLEWYVQEVKTLENFSPFRLVKEIDLHYNFLLNDVLDALKKEA